MFNRLKKDMLNARKNNEVIKKNLLGTLIGECTLTVKEPNDEIVIAAIKKFLKNNARVQEAILSTNDSSNLSSYLVEEEILNSYLPKNLSEDELRNIIGTIIENGADNTGKVMKDLKANFKNYDGKLASDIAKELLA
jgi:uncharacterized protein YqeY